MNINDITQEIVDALKENKTQFRDLPIEYQRVAKTIGKCNFQSRFNHSWHETDISTNFETLAVYRLHPDYIFPKQENELYMIEKKQIIWDPGTCDNDKMCDFMTIEGRIVGYYDSHQEIVFAMGSPRKLMTGQDYKEVAIEICNEMTKLWINTRF